MKNLLFILFIFSASSQCLATKEPEQNINSIKQFLEKHEKHKNKISQRYKNKKQNMRKFFTAEQKKIIKRKKLVPLIDRLILHKNIILNTPEDLVVFALKIKKSNLNIDQTLKRTIKKTKKGEQNFPALNEALEKQYLSEYRQNKIIEFQNSNNSLAMHFMSLSLKHDYQQKMMGAYALCIAGFYDKEFRQRTLTPKICSDPNVFYKKPKHVPGNYIPRTSISHIPDARTDAYQTLILEGKRVADELKLNDFERIMMAKCISQRVLRFFVPSHHPVKALVRTMQINTKSPDKALFKGTGVCSNFCALTYNFAVSIGIDAEIHMARRSNLHTYLEIMVGDQWYHTHPFRGVPRNCDFTPF